MTTPGASAGQPEPEIDVAEFTAQRDRVCDDFAEAECALQRGQLTRPEYAVVLALLVIAFTLTLVLQ